MSYVTHGDMIYEETIYEETIDHNPFPEVNHNTRTMIGSSVLIDARHNTYTDASHSIPTDGESKYTPIITGMSKINASNFIEVTVEVGKRFNHPNENGNFVQWIDLYSGNTFLTRVKLTPTRTHPKVTMTIQLDHVHDLKAVAWLQSAQNQDGS